MVLLAIVQRNQIPIIPYINKKKKKHSIKLSPSAWQSTASSTFPSLPSERSDRFKKQSQWCFKTGGALADCELDDNINCTAHRSAYVRFQGLVLISYIEMVSLVRVSITASVFTLKFSHPTRKFCCTIRHHRLVRPWSSSIGDRIFLWCRWRRL